MIIMKTNKEALSKQLFKEYANLSRLNHLNTYQQERLAVILHKSVSDLSLYKLIKQFQIEEFERELFSLEDKQDLLNEQLKLQENFVGSFDEIKNKS